MKKKPIIGIGPHYLTNPKRKKVIGCYENYIRCLELAGASTLIFTADMEHIDYHLSLVDGIMITGGDDIHPHYYHERKLPKIKFELSPNERTDYDMALLKKALKQDIPYLGICLGCQTLNVVQGGSLYQDMPSQLEKVNDHKKGQHWIDLEKKTLLHSILKKDRVKVNSNHHQAVKQPGDNIIVTARALDGTAEAIESTKHSFALGVQWHPEELLKTEVSKNIFKAFVKACKKTKS